MKVTSSNTTTAGAKAPKTTDTNLSSDGKWRSFPKVPNLLQYVIAGTFYARCKVNGKSVRVSLDTTVFTVAKDRLPDTLKKLRKPKAQSGTFGDGRSRYETETVNGYTSKKNRRVKLAPLSIAYRLRCAENLMRSLVEVLFNEGEEIEWSKLDDSEKQKLFSKLNEMRASDITKDHCDAWQAHYDGYAPSFYNNTVNTFRRILELAGVPHDENPAYKIGRKDILEKPIRLPNPEQFDQIVKHVETSGAAQAKDCANLVRFLAFTGTRISEAKQAVWGDVDLSQNTIELHSVKVRGQHAQGQDVTRKIPLNPALRQLLEKLRAGREVQPSDRILKVSECQKSLDRACNLAKCKRLTHHDLRHYFVTKCLQAGVDVFTVAKWVGHRDNGKLLLKVYSHLQAEHSQEQAAKLVFGSQPTQAAQPVANATLN